MEFLNQNTNTTGPLRNRPQLVQSIAFDGGVYSVIYQPNPPKMVDVDEIDFVQTFFPLDPSQARQYFQGGGHYESGKENEVLASTPK